MKITEANYQDVLNQMIAEKDAEEKKEAARVKPLSKAEAQRQRAVLKSWLVNGKYQMNRAGGNFWMRGRERARCSIYRPAQLKQLIDAGILRKLSESSYELIPE